jgi:hypothetical protein
MPFSLRTFDLHEMLRCILDLRGLIQGAISMEETSREIVRYLRESFVDPVTNTPECPLVRFYKTHSYGGLEPELQEFAAQRMEGFTPQAKMKCLVLLATAGAEPEWNSRRQSDGHQAIPLPSRKIVERAPMIAELIRQMGLDIDSVVAPRPELLRKMEERTYNVFFVPEATGSPFIPAQAEFVDPYRIRSVVGFGGLLLTGELYAVILFSTVRVPPEAADRFRNIALELRIGISAFGVDRTFDPEMVTE